MLGSITLDLSVKLYIDIFNVYFFSPDLLCPEEEEQSGYISSCVPSLHHALHLVVWCSICSR